MSAYSYVIGPAKPMMGKRVGRRPQRPRKTPAKKHRRTCRIVLINDIYLRLSSRENRQRKVLVRVWRAKCACWTDADETDNEVRSTRKFVVAEPSGMRIVSCDDCDRPIKLLRTALMSPAVVVVRSCSCVSRAPVRSTATTPHRLSVGVVYCVWNVGHGKSTGWKLCPPLVFFFYAARLSSNWIVVTAMLNRHYIGETE